MPSNIKKFAKKNPKFVKGAKIAGVVTGGIAVTAATGGIAGVAIAGAAAVAGTAAAGVTIASTIISTSAAIGVGTVAYVGGKNKIDKITVEENSSLFKSYDETPYYSESEADTFHDDDQQKQKPLLESFV